MPIELHAVHDAQGTIIAASLVDPQDQSTPVAIPQPSDDTHFARIQLDEAHAKMPLEQLCTTTRIDPERKCLIAHDDTAD
jgi:hypothetical protein